MFLEEPHIRQLPDATADCGLQAGSTDGDAAKADLVTQLPASVLNPQKIANHVAAWRAKGFQFVHQAREVRVHDAVTAGKQPVRMSRLWHAFSDQRLVGQPIALDDGDLIEMRAERARGQQAPDAGAENNSRAMTIRHALVDRSVALPRKRSIRGTLASERRLPRAREVPGGLEPGWPLSGDAERSLQRETG